jgi:steroid delta-isomerase-like uncharacterized protein
MQASMKSDSTPIKDTLPAILAVQEGTNRRPVSVVERNKQVTRRIWSDLVNGGRLESLPELVSNDFIDHAPLPGLSQDISGLRQRLRMLHDAFPDFRSDIIELLAENDKVVAVVESRGTHQGTFAGLPPTGRRFSIQEIQILRIENGQMIEHWQVADLFGMFKQLGLASSPVACAV